MRVAPARLATASTSPIVRRTVSSRTEARCCHPCGDAVRIAGAPRFDQCNANEKSIATRDATGFPWTSAGVNRQALRA